MTTDTDKLVELLRETGAEEAVAGLFYVTAEKAAALLLAEIERLDRAGRTIPADGKIGSAA